MQEKSKEAYKETVGETGVKSLWEGTDVLSFFNTEQIKILHTDTNFIISYALFFETIHHYLILLIQFQKHIHQINFVLDVKTLFLYHSLQFDAHHSQLLQ